MAIFAVMVCLHGARQFRREAVAPPPTPPQLTLLAVGDILMHGDVKQAARERGGFHFLWEELAPLFRQTDLVFGNLETPVAPLMGGSGKPYIFNAPADLLADIKSSGFHILSTANNHSYDQGVKGLVETQTRLTAEGLIFIGSGQSRPHSMETKIVERNGIRLAFLAYTDLFNVRLNRHEDEPWVNELSEEETCRRVRTARQQADAVVVSVHWGIEDHRIPSRRQRMMALKLVEAGADVILGHHPHVLQPLEIIENDGRKAAVVYSMGNFISNQNRTYNPLRMPLVEGDERDGAAVRVWFVRDASGRVGLNQIGYTPLWTENNWRAMRTGRETRRDIHVVRLDDPARQTQPWLKRRARIQEVMGAAFELDWATSNP